MIPNPVVGRLTAWARRLRFPQLFALTVGLLVLDIFIPDFVPFADEIVLALATLLLGSLRRRVPRGGTRGDASSV